MSSLNGRRRTSSTVSAWRGKPRLGVPVRGDKEKRPPGQFQLPDNPLEEGNGREEESQFEVPPLAECVNRFRDVRGVPGVEAPRLCRLARSKEIDLGVTPESRYLVKNPGGEVPVRDRLEPRGCVCLDVLLRGDVGRQQTQLTLVGEMEDPLGSLEESPSPEASLLVWASAVVLSILHRMDVWRVDGGKIHAKKIHKTESSLGNDAF
jgi:hypothetical protein